MVTDLPVFYDLFSYYILKFGTNVLLLEELVFFFRGKTFLLIIFKDLFFLRVTDICKF